MEGDERFCELHPAPSQSFPALAPFIVISKDTIGSEVDAVVKLEVEEVENETMMRGNSERKGEREELGGHGEVACTF